METVTQYQLPTWQNPQSPWWQTQHVALRGAALANGTSQRKNYTSTHEDGPNAHKPAYWAVPEPGKVSCNINSCRKWKGTIPTEKKMQGHHNGKWKPYQAHSRLLAHIVGRSPFNKHRPTHLDRSQSYRPDPKAWPFTTGNKEADFISWFQKAKPQYFKLLLLGPIFVLLLFCACYGLPCSVRCICIDA